jgi:hypothetical protein
MGGAVRLTEAHDLGLYFKKTSFIFAPFWVERGHFKVAVLLLKC